MEQVLRIQIANKKLSDLLFDNRWRYKVAHGGRGGSKSYAFADACLARILSQKTSVTVCRELQTTIRDSVHQLIKDRIANYDLNEHFDITENEIRCKNGSTIKYKHLHNNYVEIKGLEGTDICWVFEAQNVSKESWDVLDPTIRKPGAEIWVEFNPNLEDDFVYQFFVVNPPSTAKVVQINYMENPACPPELIALAEECKRTRPNEYRHIWLGEPAKTGSKIYPKFNKEVHVKDYPLDVIEKSGQLFFAQDPHTIYYPFCIWGARIPKGKEYEWVIYNEFPTLDFFNGKYYYELRNEEVCSLTMLDVANVIKVLDQTVGDFQLSHSPERRYIDTRFAKASGARSWSSNTEGMVAEYASPKNGGLRFKCPPEKDIDVQRDVIRGLINYNEAIPICSINEPKLWIMPHCYNVIDAMLNHRFDLDNRREDEKRKDPVDALRIMLAGASRVDYEGPNDKEKEEPFIVNRPRVNLSHSLT